MPPWTMAVKVAQSNAQVLSVAPNRIVIGTPALPDGLQTVTLSDPATGGSSVLTTFSPTAPGRMILSC